MRLTCLTEYGVVPWSTNELDAAELSKKQGFVGTSSRVRPSLGERISEKQRMQKKLTSVFWLVLTSFKDEEKQTVRVKEEKTRGVKGRGTDFLRNKQKTHKNNNNP